jgi:hypothetical protein
MLWWGRGQFLGFVAAVLFTDIAGRMANKKIHEENNLLGPRSQHNPLFLVTSMTPSVLAPVHT